MMLALLSSDAVAEIGSELLGSAVSSATLVAGGRNNRIFRLIGTGGTAALKFYPLQREDPRDRLNREYAALSFLHRHGVADVPRPLARDDNRRCAVYEWIEGEPPGPATATDVDALAEFFIALQELRRSDGADQLAAASASCLSLERAVIQLQQRIRRLGAAVSAGSRAYPFVNKRLVPEAARLIRHVRERATGVGLDFSAQLPRVKQTLSPSDFGLHNALRRPTGQLAFLDFEYFGWDDPAKAVADVMFHPGSSFPSRLAERYRSRLEAVLSPADPEFSLRLELMRPLIGLMWCVMLLNELLPERWARRALAGMEEPRAVAEARQLEKARSLFARIVA